MLGGTGNPSTGQLLPGTHLQRLALGPLLAQLLPQVLQVPPATCQDGSAGARTSSKQPGATGDPLAPTHRCWTRIRSTRMCRVRTSAFRSSRASDLPSDPSDTSSPSVLHGRTGACPMLGTGAQSPARGSPQGCSPPQGLPPLPRAMLGGCWPGTRGRVAVGWLSLAVVTDTVLKPLASAKERTGISTWC